MATAQEQGQVGHRYVGFWVRLLASIIDSLLVTAVLAPVFYALYGAELMALLEAGGAPAAPPAGPGPLVSLLLNFVLPAIAVVLFWVYRSATPGKMVFGAVIVDAATGGKPSTGQLIARYLGYYVSLIPLGLGFLWIAFDRRKQGWHDKLAGTAVVRRAR